MRKFIAVPGPAAKWQKSYKFLLASIGHSDFPFFFSKGEQSDPLQQVTDSGKAGKESNEEGHLRELMKISQQHGPQQTRSFGVHD